ncbi:hypothetical protein BGZ99_004481 [Dissophora globulifera]|uniref:C2H2-type domain-containing protein n=1 Tax=Dissophora globulifera TaxID=979702 RepID=A0A9P6UUR2_9FUNG|nr:hypothetical protein BGZ99_004481 [Dissophora globulifera]
MNVDSEEPQASSASADQPSQEPNDTAMSSVNRPDSTDTISFPRPSSSSPPSEPTLKQEDPFSQEGYISHLRADTDHADDEDSDGEGREDEHSEAENDDKELQEDSELLAQPGGAKSERRGGGGGRVDDDGELSLSSDNDDDEEMASAHPDGDEYSNIPEETVCRWKDCGKVLPSLAALVIHLSDEHIGWKKTSYTCEWQGCARRPIAQTTRFALISHMRSHTKHKPYDCPVPECDKSFSRSDAMAKHLKCQHGDVPERFTGRKSRGRYTMKDPAASSTLLPSSSSGAKKRRHHETSRSDVETSSALAMRLNPAKLRKLGGDVYSNGGGDHSRHHRKFADTLLLEQLDHTRRGRRLREDLYNARRQDLDGEEEEEDDDAEDSDFAVDNGQSPRERYGILKAKFQYIHNERDLLESEYDEMKKKLTRLRVERELLLDALLASEQEYQDPALQDIEDSE